MNKNAHTPGPWKVHPYSESLIEILGGGELVATIGAHRENSGADAVLVAAAPELLEALEALLDACNGTLKFQRPRVLENARTAIAKARGLQ